MSAEDIFPGLSTDELRSAVRAVLRDVLPALDTARTPSSTAGEMVDLRTDADLASFVGRVAALCADPVQRTALEQGRHAFRLRVVADAARPEPGVVRVDSGAVTERTVTLAAADGARLVLGKRAVLTPLARDKARSLGVDVTKES